jgi:transmembrane sensor
LIKIENIDDLLGKFFSGEASPEEAMLLDDWKNETAENLRHYKNSEKLFALLHQEHAAVEPNTALAWKKVKQKIEAPVKEIPIRKIPYYWLAAAGITLIIGLGVLLTYVIKEDKQQEIVYVTKKEVKEIKLADGSNIAISPNSNLKVDKNFGKKNRMLHLKGEAAFSVVHREELPFIVDAGNVFIKDIGTKFVVKSSADTDTVYVKVDEGVVLLFDSLGSSLEIKATEQAVYIRSIRKIVSGAGIHKVNSNVQFLQASLNEVIIQLNSIYNTNIALENNTLGNCTITTQFNQESLETVLGVITETLGLSYEKTPTGYLIKGQSCQPQ